MITIIDYGMSNLRSIEFKLRRYNKNIRISSEESKILSSTKLILAGVGHFGKAMHNLEKRGLIDLLNKKVLGDKTPIFGICLGMQLFTEYSEEGDCKGLGWVKGKTTKFNFETSKKELRIPHVGWNNIVPVKSHSILDKVQSREFYFTHSFYVECKDSSDVLSYTNYGIDFVSSLSKENMIGTQFHPEKSYQEGFQLLKNFVVKNA